jgi:hypothetical protein
MPPTRSPSSWWTPNRASRRAFSSPKHGRSHDDRQTDVGQHDDRQTDVRTARTRDDAHLWLRVADGRSNRLASSTGKRGRPLGGRSRNHDLGSQGPKKYRDNRSAGVPRHHDLGSQGPSKRGRPLGGRSRNHDLGSQGPKKYRDNRSAGVPRHHDLGSQGLVSTVCTCLRVREPGGQPFFCSRTEGKAPNMTVH